MPHSAKTKPHHKEVKRREKLSDEGLLELVQRQTFLFFWDGAQPASGRRRGRAAHAPLPLRRGPARRGLPGRGALLPPLRRPRPRRPRPPPLQGSPSTSRTCCASAASADADVVHYQWLTVPALDAPLLRRLRPRVMTAHYILPPHAEPPPVAAARRVFGRMDAVVAHSEHSAARLRDEVGLDPAQGPGHPPWRLRLPHPPAGGEAAAGGAGGRRGPGDPLLRPAASLQGHGEPARGVPPASTGAELWIVGNPRMDVEPLRELAAAAPGRVRFVTRFVEDAEIPAIFRRADVVALPYLDAEHSGVLYTGLAFGKPLVLSAVGGFPEVAATGAARLVPPGDAAALAAALARAGRRRPPATSSPPPPRRRRRSLLLGRGRPPHPRPLPRAARGAPMTPSPRSSSGSAPA